MDDTTVKFPEGICTDKPTTSAIPTPKAYRKETIDTDLLLPLADFTTDIVTEPFEEEKDPRDTAGNACFGNNNDDIMVN